MSTFNDKNTGKTLDTRAANIESFKALITASGTTVVNGRAGADIDGKRHEFVGFSQIPFRYKQGDQAKFFPGIDTETRGGVNTGSEDVVRNTTDGIIYFSVSPSKFAENLVGNNSHISRSLASKHGTSGLASKGSAYTQISQSVVNLFSASIAAETNITIAAQENYTAGSTSESVVNNTAPPTASITFRSPEGSASYSGIATPGQDSTISQGYQIVVDLSDSVSCHQFFLRSAPGTGVGRDIYFEQFFPSFSIDLRHGTTEGTGSFVMGVGSGNTTSPTTLSYITASTANFFLGQNLFTPIAVPAFTQSEAIFGVSDPININKINGDEGKFRIVEFKGVAVGDGTGSGNFFNFKSSIDGGDVGPDAAIVVYESASAVSSGTFKFVPITSSSNAATASSDVRTIHFISGSHSTPGFQGLFTGSQDGLLFGSFVHKDNKLRVPADIGYYSPTGSDVVGDHVFEFNTSSFSGTTPVSSGSRYVPRVVRKHI
jgi:hypothetical protein